MRQSRFSRALVGFVLLAAVTPAVASADATDAAGIGRTTVRSVTGAVLGTIRFDINNRKIVLSGRLSGISTGFHGFHIHAVGVCDPNSTDPNGAVVPFLTAGGHLNLGGTTHGDHTGDLPSLRVSADGTAITTTENDDLSAAALFDADGSAIIIHALPDNFAHIPVRYAPGGPDAATQATGDAGGRIACGVITRG
nr:Superoxide dismutase [Cu-Zn] precursor [Kibdelosporangium sp. MJ126-NF4]CTQ94220.1 Superoxide dismutase [Cu-Zn] precursor (EC 1.15.1.1) [Kibdelosporangium sp. MJ126-NF4]